MRTMQFFPVPVVVENVPMAANDSRTLCRFRAFENEHGCRAKEVLVTPEQATAEARKFLADVVAGTCETVLSFKTGKMYDNPVAMAVAEGFVPEVLIEAFSGSLSCVQVAPGGMAK